MQFLDECTLIVQAGDGGHGCVAFRREAHQPRGGPSGGNGGQGGSIWLIADPQVNTLLDISYKKEYRASSGEPGQGRDKNGKSGNHINIPVPVGTLVKDQNGQLLADLKNPGQSFRAAAGGMGGLGNLHFVTSTNQAPHQATPGQPGERRTLHLEVSLLADVGLLGYPNVGKSTFISRISSARPKIADYPFTTLTPQLGVVRLPLDHPRPNRSLVVADLPGLIEGAHQGKGLGHQFLRHLQRTGLLIHIVTTVDEEERSPWHDYEVLTQELIRYNPDLAHRPQLVAFSKMDLPENQANFSFWKEVFAKHGIELHGISAVTGEGISALIEKAYQQIKTQSPIHVL